MMAEDRDGQGLNDTQAERSTSPAVRIASYGVIIASHLREIGAIIA